MNRGFWNIRLSPTILIGVGLALYAWFCVSSLNKPLIDDEVEYRASAMAIVESGKPIYYMGTTPDRYIPLNQRWIYHSTPNPDFQYGLWHTPLHVYTLGLACKCLGTANWVFRMPSAISYLIVWLLLCNLARLLLPREKWKLVTGVFSTLYFVNPLMVQQGLLVDIDTSAVPLTSFLFLHELIRLEKNGTARIRKFAWLGVLLILAYWAKEFTGIFLTVSIFVYYALRRQWADLVGVVCLFVAGTALFWGSWWLFCTLTNMPVRYFIDFSGSKLARGEGVIFSMIREAGIGSALGAIISSLLYIIAWMSPFYLILALMGTSWRVGLFWKNKKIELLDLLFVYAGILFAATQIYRPSGPLLRYAFPMHSILLFLIAIFLCEFCGKTKPWQWLVGGVVSLVIAGIQIKFVGDPLLTLYHKGPWSLGESGLWKYCLAVAVILLILAPLIWQKSKFPVWAAASLVTALVGYSLGLGFEQSQPQVNFSYISYGERGNDEMSAYMLSVLQPDEMPICRKDFGYTLNRKLGEKLQHWYNLDLINSVRSREELVANITAPNVRHILIDSYMVRQDALPVIMEYYVVDHQIDKFYLLRRKETFSLSPMRWK